MVLDMALGWTRTSKLKLNSHKMGKPESLNGGLQVILKVSRFLKTKLRVWEVQVVAVVSHWPFLNPFSWYTSSGPVTWLEQPHPCHPCPGHITRLHSLETAIKMTGGIVAV